MKRIQYVRTEPYHLASSGQAEQVVQPLKRSLTKQKGCALEDRVARFLLNYLVTPHSTIGMPLCGLLIRKRLCSLLDCV